MLNLSLHPTTPSSSLSPLGVSTGGLGTPQVLPKAPSLRGGGDGGASAPPCPQLCSPFPAPVGRCRQPRVPRSRLLPHSSAQASAGPHSSSARPGPMPEQDGPPVDTGHVPALVLAPLLRHTRLLPSHAAGHALASGWVHPTSCPPSLWGLQEGAPRGPCREHSALLGCSLSPPLGEAGQGEAHNLGHPRALAWGGSCAPQVVPSPMSLLGSSPPGAGVFSPLQTPAGAGALAGGLDPLLAGPLEPPSPGTAGLSLSSPPGAPVPALPRALLTAESREAASCTRPARPRPRAGRGDPGLLSPGCAGVGVRRLTRRRVTLNKEHLNRESQRRASRAA